MPSLARKFCPSKFTDFARRCDARCEFLQQLCDQWPKINYRKSKYKVNEETMFFIELIGRVRQLEKRINMVRNRQIEKRGEKLLDVNKQVSFQITHVWNKNNI